MRRLAFSALLLVLSACNTQEVTPVRVKVTADLPKEARELLQKDFSRLENSPIQEPAGESARIFGVPSIDRNSLVKWLNERVRILVSDSFLSVQEVQEGNTPRNFAVLAADQVYEYPNTLPDALDHSAHARGKSVSLGENLGIGLYVLQKFSHQLFGVWLPEAQEVLPISTPRVGILALGHSLFDDWLGENIRFQDKTLEGKLDSLLASEYRLGILLHEARHSDGHGKSLGFLHGTCPQGHDYAGQAACDNSLNGAYAIGGHYLKLMARDCKGCSEKEREVLRVFALDSLARVLPSKQIRVSEEETLARCGDLLKERKPLPDRCYYNEIPNEYWEPAPEGLVK